MTYTHPIEWLRRTVLPFVGQFVAEIDDELPGRQYVRRPTHHTEFVGLVPYREQELRDRLRDADCVLNPISALKNINGTDHIEEGSYAWRGEIRRAGNDTTFHHDPWADKQLHLIFFEIDNDRTTTAVFAHWEYSWLTHPIKHYRGVDNSDVTGSRLCRTFFEDVGIEYTREPLDDLLRSSKETKQTLQATP